MPHSAPKVTNWSPLLCPVPFSCLPVRFFISKVYFLELLESSPACFKLCFIEAEEQGLGLHHRVLHSMESLGAWHFMFGTQCFVIVKLAYYFVNLSLFAEMLMLCLFMTFKKKKQSNFKVSTCQEWLWQEVACCEKPRGRGPFIADKHLRIRVLFHFQVMARHPSSSVRKWRPSRPASRRVWPKSF